MNDDKIRLRFINAIDPIQLSNAIKKHMSQIACLDDTLLSVRGRLRDKHFLSRCSTSLFCGCELNIVQVGEQTFI